MGVAAAGDSCRSLKKRRTSVADAGMWTLKPAMQSLTKGSSLVLATLGRTQRYDWLRNRLYLAGAFSSTILLVEAEFSSLG